MRSHVATTGRVATLLGRDWYDDGAQDLVGRYAVLESEAYARAVKDVSPSQFVALLENDAGPRAGRRHAARGRRRDDAGAASGADRPAGASPAGAAQSARPDAGEGGPLRQADRRPRARGSPAARPRRARPAHLQRLVLGPGAGAPAAVVRARAPAGKRGSAASGAGTTKAANGSPWRRWRSSNCDAAARPRRSTGARSQTSPGWRTSCARTSPRSRAGPPPLDGIPETPTLGSQVGARYPSMNAP